MKAESSEKVNPGGTPVPFGTPEILAAVAGAERVLDAGCGSGRLTRGARGGGRRGDRDRHERFATRGGSASRRGSGRLADPPRGRLQRTASVRRRVIRRGDEPPRADGRGRRGRNAHRAPSRARARRSARDRAVGHTGREPLVRSAARGDRSGARARASVVRAGVRQARGAGGSGSRAPGSGAVRGRGSSRTAGTATRRTRRRTGWSCRPRTATSAELRPL